jgi:hypothetical protein
MPINPQADGVEISGLRQRILKQTATNRVPDSVLYSVASYHGSSPRGRKFPLYLDGVCRLLATSRQRSLHRGFCETTHDVLA